MPAPLLVVGLGNPGPAYAATRHNVGFDVVECWVARRGWHFQPEPELESRCAQGRLGERPTIALLPQTFMNRSGRAVAHAIERFAIEDPGDLLVVLDDLDLPFGRLRLRPSGGAGGHRGLADIQGVLGREDFPRLRIGIGRPASSGDVVDFVLSPFSPDEARTLGAIHERGADAIDLALTEGPRAAMNRVNATPSRDAEGE